MTKKILYCDSNTDGTIGGSYYSMLFLASGINKEKYISHVIFYTDNELIPTYRAAGIDTHVFVRPSPFHFSAWIAKHVLPIPILGHFLKAIQKSINMLRFLPLMAIKYARYLKKHNIDIVHLNNSILRSHDWILAAIIARKKCVVHERGINHHYSQLAKIFSRKVDAIICISNAVKQSLISGGLGTAPLFMVYNGVDPERVKPEREANDVRNVLGIMESDLVIGVVGNIKYWKGQITIVKAMHQVYRKFPQTKCILVGDTSPSDEGYKKELLELIEELNLQRNIIFTGYQSNVADMLNIMDIAVHTSVQPEPFGRVIIEAMAMRKTVMGTDAGAVPEIIEHNKTGLVFEPGNHEQLADFLVSLLGNPEKRHTLGEAGYQRLVKNFSINQYLEGVQNVYDHILK